MPGRALLRTDLGAAFPLGVWLLPGILIEGAGQQIPHAVCAGGEFAHP